MTTGVMRAPPDVLETSQERHRRVKYPKRWRKEATLMNIEILYCGE